MVDAEDEKIGFHAEAVQILTNALTVVPSFQIQPCFREYALASASLLSSRSHCVLQFFPCLTSIEHA